MDLRTVNVTRYIMPLREGGSLPALAEADDDFKYVVKFRGAGHGTKALIAELIGGEIARDLHFRVPEIVFLQLDEAFGRTEADEEIQDLLQWMWHKELWLIDHGAALYFHHSWENWQKQAVNPFLRIKDHVLLPYASQLEEADNRFKQILTEEKLQEITDAIPDDWLTWAEEGETIQDLREVYFHFLKERVHHSELFVKEAQNARKALI